MAAASAFAAVAFHIASFVIQLPAFRDAPGPGDALRYRQTLLSFHEHAGALFGSAVTQAIATFLAVGALFYLFRATRHRRAQPPQPVRWLLVVAPVLIAVAGFANTSRLQDAADRYTSPTGLAGTRATLDRDQREDIARICRTQTPGAAVRRCRVTRERQEAVAEHLVRDNQRGVGSAARFGGTLALAFAIVIISLNAMRAGLLSRLLGYLGIFAGVVIVLPVSQGVPVLQILWLGALGALFLGAWPGGRGPAWETGEATPWPRAAAGPGLPSAGLPEREAGTEAEPSARLAGEAAPAEPRPVSKKRKRRR